MTDDWYPRMRSLLETAAPAVLTTCPADGEAAVSPVWFRWLDGAFEVVIAESDRKLRHLERDPRCSLLIFETSPPFRGIHAWGTAELTRGDATEARAAIATRYLGEGDGGVSPTRGGRSAASSFDWRRRRSACGPSRRSCPVSR